MKRNAFNSITGVFIRLVFMAMALLALAGPFHAWGEERKSVTSPTPKPDRAQLEAQFTKANADRAAVAEKTKERADAARNAMHIASDIAWMAFDAGRFEEASTWFARGVELKEDNHVNARAYWEEYQRVTAAEIEANLGDRIKEFQAQLAAAEEPKKEDLRKAIDALEKTRYVMRYNAVTMLENIARENNDAAGLVRYAEAELEIRRLEMGYLERSGAPKQEINRKNAEIATSMGRIAGAQADLALFDKAEKNYLEALAIRTALPEDMAERKVEDTLSALGGMYAHNVGDLVKAREYYQQALASIEISAALRQKALGEDYLSAEQRAQMAKEDLARHNESLAQSRDMAVALDCLSQALVLANLGGIVEEGGDLKSALSYYERALKLGAVLPSGGYMRIFDLVRARIRARVVGDMAYLHAESGEVDLALKELNEAVAIKRDIGEDDWTAQSLQQVGDLSYGKGDLESARRNIEQARRIFAAAHQLSRVVSATDFLAVIARDEGKLDEAARSAEEALVLARKTGNFGVISSSARTFASIRVKQNKLEEATTLIDEARAADTRTASVGDRIGTLGVGGEILEMQGDNEKALEAYKEAVKLVESVRSTAASETAFADVKRNYRPYERIVRTLIKLNRADEAFDYLNRAKSKKLQESLRLSSMKSGDKAMQALLDRANGLETRLNAATTQLRTEEAKPEPERDKTKIENLKTVVASTQGEFRRVVEQIKSSNPNWEKFMTVNPKALKETQRSIPPGVMLVQYAPLGEQLYIFLVGKESLKIVIAPGKPDDLWKKIKTVRTQITTGESGPPLAKNLVALYDLLITPIESELEPVKIIAFIPNQLLFYLPIQALAKKKADGELRYLIEDKQIVYLTAADVMNVVQPPDNEKSPGGMVAFGNPTGANLPAAEAEVKAIAQVYPFTEVLSDGEVTKVALNAEQRLNKRIVHFATHGILNATTPSESYIQLAKAATPGQEHLTVGEVWDLPFKKVSLVTLSACESALGDKEPDGGEITTLAEAFSSAGATTVLASLWSVGDESTKELMVEFYRQLAAGQSKAAALQSAEIKLLKNPKFSRPLYWAPFILMGDWR